MVIARKPALAELFVDKRELRQLLAQSAHDLGIAEDPQATAQKAREMMRALGIRPEDNAFSRSLVAIREE